jgi:hypothetical protein
MTTEDKATATMAVTTLIVAFMGAMVGWGMGIFVTVGLLAGGYAAALVSWGDGG